MKKIFLMLLGIAATINAMAVDYTAQAMITITSSTGYYNSMIVQEAAIYGNSIAGAEMNLEGNGAFLYGINESTSTKLQVVRGADLNGVQLGVKTDAGTEFTFTVSSVTGSNPLYFMDAQGDNHLLENGASFVISDLAANSTIENRFSLGRPAAKSICFNYNHLIVTGYAGSTLKVEKAGVAVVAEQTLASDNEDFDLSAENGRLVVTLNGVEYQIDANPAVTPVP